MTFCRSKVNIFKPHRLVYDMVWERFGAANRSLFKDRAGLQALLDTALVQSG
jgi:hypothetical protein